jgi:hypothetical protein
MKFKTVLLCAIAVIAFSALLPTAFADDGCIKSYDCIDDVPDNDGWDTMADSIRPCDNDGNYCKEGDDKSQVVGFLLSFLIGWTGAGYFYYGHMGLGAAIIILVCCGAPCAGAAGGAAKSSESKAAMAIAPLCGCISIAGYCWATAVWIMMITKGVLPEDKCPLNCNLS